MNSSTQEFIELCRQQRAQIKVIARAVQLGHKHDALAWTSIPDPHSQDTTPAELMAEIHANLELAYRHLEDAAMRLGKAIQAADGRVSMYDK